MGRTKTVSDRLAKRKAKEWLESNGFTDVRPAKNESCDLIGKKGGKTFYIEIKYSSKEKGVFFGTVMLTEMFQAISNKENYLFLICRGTSNDLNDWFFKLFNVQDFIKHCALTTPIFLYSLYINENKEGVVPKFRKSTTLASEELISEMWQDFKKWKSKSYLFRLKE